MSRRCSRAQVGDDGLGEGTIGAGRHLQRGGDGRRHQRRIGQGRQIDEDHAIGELRRDVVRDGQGQPGLADPAGTGQRQQRNGLIQEEGAGSGQLRLPADEPGAGNGAASQLDSPWRQRPRRAPQ